MTNPSPSHLNIHPQTARSPIAFGSAISQRIDRQNTHARSQTQTQTSAIDRHRCKLRPLKKMIKQPNSG
ncbi:MAG: hypothetical protein RLZZ135_1571 [Cyanobacteriota bacterium]|jgi:hypothetical protein